MPNYRYNAIDSAGKWISGEIHGTNHDEVEARLRADGLRVESLTEAEPKERLKAISRDEMAELVEQLASLTKSGLPLPSGLRAAGLELMSPSLRSTFLELADKLESGSNLDEALLSSSPRFPPHLRGLILAGSRSGRLADLLAEYVRGANLGSELRRMFWSTLLYPALALALILGIVGFVCSLSVKAIDTLTSDLPNFGQRRVNNIEVLTTLARFIADHGLGILFGALIVAIGIWATLRFGMKPSQRRRVICSIPVLGPILRFTSLNEFCHLLAMLIEAGLPLPLAFELAGASVRDAEVAEACGRMGRAVEEGEPLSAAVKLWDAIPAGLGQLFRWSEDRRSLPEALHLAGDMFESRARSQSSFASSVMATFLLLLILWWVGFAIATLYLPLISMIGRLSG